MRDKRRRSSLARRSDRRRSRSEERYAPRTPSVSFDDTLSERPRRSSRESARDGSSSSGEYEIVEIYNDDSAGDDDRWDDDEKDKTGSESDSYRQSQAYMIIAAVMVASAFLGVLMKFAFTPTHSGHSHGLRRVPGRVLVEETEATTPFDATLSTLKINVSVIKDLATEPKSPTAAEVTAPGPRKSAFTYECRTDACLWQSRLIYDKINQSIGPCEDFYAYVCSNRWYNSELEVHSRPYVVSGPGLLILDIAKFLLQQKTRDQSSTFISHSSMFLRNCIQVRNSSSTENDWQDIKKVLESYSLTNWPFMTDPPTVKFQDVLKLVDKRLNLLAVVHVTLRKRFENEGYMMHLDSPRLTMVRHQMTFLDEGFQEYKNCIKRAFTLLGSKVETDHIADDVLEFERKLDEASLPPKRFVSILNSTVSIVNLKRAGKLEWDAYLTYLQPGSEKVIVVNSAFINKLSGILTSTALSTLLNYVGFRILVLLSPLLPKQAEFLVPLSYDDHIHKYNARLQACIHLTERLFPYGIRKIARAAMGKTTMEQIAYDHNLDKMVSSVKGVVSQTVARAPWLTQTEADVATQKIESLEVDFIGAKEHMDAINAYYQSRVEVSFSMESGGARLHDATKRDHVALLALQGQRRLRRALPRVLPEARVRVQRGQERLARTVRRGRSPAACGPVGDTGHPDALHRTLPRGRHVRGDRRARLDHQRARHARDVVERRDAGALPAAAEVLHAKLPGEHSALRHLPGVPDGALPAQLHGRGRGAPAVVRGLHPRPRGAALDAAELPHPRTSRPDARDALLRQPRCVPLRPRQQPGTDGTGQAKTPVPHRAAVLAESEHPAASLRHLRRDVLLHQGYLHESRR
ncbi:hypothetical protein MTO96_024213 [Rhipicephalus appendiculatus]